MRKAANVVKVFRKRLLQLRTEKRLSQSKLAKQLGISPATIGYYENGDRLPDIDIAARIANFFDVTADYLLGFSNSRTAEKSMKTACAVTGLSEEAIKNIQETKKLLDEGNNEVYISNKKTIEGIEPYEILNLFLSSRTFQGVLLNFLDMAKNYKVLFLLHWLFADLDQIDEESKTDEECEERVKSEFEKKPFLKDFLIMGDREPASICDYIITCSLFEDHADLSEYKATKCMRDMFDEYKDLARKHGFALAEKYFEEAECEHQKEEQEKKQNDETNF